VKKDLGNAVSFAIAGAASFALMASAFIESFNTARLAAVLAALLALHAARFARVSFTREALIYALFLAYMVVELIWTRDRVLGLNTIVPAINFVVVIVLFSSLADFHDLDAVLGGTLAGFAAGAVWYSGISGFPFHYPAAFSYNAIAAMYLFGFIVAVLMLAHVDRMKAFYFLAVAVIAGHVVATTSIKTNVGILLGAFAAFTVHFTHASRLVWRHALFVTAAVAVVVAAVASNDAAVASIERGSRRVELGLEILQAREDMQGYSAFGRRANWQREGFEAWVHNPVFGQGVEAFRADHGITSHASHVDLAYNSGLIGLGLFYGLFASMFMRLYRKRNAGLPDVRLVVFGATVCWVFISFAGTIHYSAYLAAFLALGASIVKRA
jgi:hypothetical protein